ncbi:aminoglycoside phosphotransferase family protein [Halobacillus aidingensis]|uniref:Ser/Thr protein kinase RdoA involved in Cpx stress response, MazF antagonist n=1 Tax=Halobacillus aidingensis TaxID=240303 RepID=A0A1H0T1E1_HALAD|nr:aminoglycoside phosphotransferase family protein [Halobacillus aidingensis]SDP47406.1 Ser/Thr protein kinase RdoA involved in Cpx stress response, MazF antagonist [Halobacillus aidingensis]
MSRRQSDVQWQRLCFHADLGKLVSSPETLTGGLLHRMYLVKTTKGNYAVKILNPEIMKRPEAMKNYMNSEKISNLVSNHIPALPANVINGRIVNETDNQFYMVFDWIKGRSLKHIEIRTTHSKKIGSILADIHKVNFEELNIEYGGINNGHFIEWHSYLEKGQQASAEWVTLLKRNIDKLYEWESKSKKAADVLSSEIVISHRDLDPKNVMWHQGSPVVIDWESAGYITPMQDLIETATYWSTDGRGNINKSRFLAFIEGYIKNSVELCADWERVLETGYLGKLGWLEYNLKRSLKMECSDEDEQKLGSVQVTETIMELQQYENSLPILRDWLSNEQDV